MRSWTTWKKRSSKRKHRASKTSSPCCSCRLPYWSRSKRSSDSRSCGGSREVGIRLRIRLGIVVAVICALALLGYAAAIAWGSVRQARATRTFGDPRLLGALVTYDGAARRAVKAVLLVVAMVLAFVALARPQFGSGTKIVPATNLDVAVVLDY